VEGNHVLFDPLLYGVVAIVAIVVVALLFYATRDKSKKETPKEKETSTINSTPPFTVQRTVTSTDSKRAQNELRILDVEREILSNAIRRLYEAQAEGKISEEERNNLLQGYKDRMLSVKERITKSESVVSLNELEIMHGDLLKLFDERFNEINEKIVNLRTTLSLQPEIADAPPPSPAPPVSPRKTTRKIRKPGTPKKTQAEQRIDEIRAEVEKVLARLGQIEVEA
jgi:hypothetical protein